MTGAGAAPALSAGQTLGASARGASQMKKTLSGNGRFTGRAQVPERIEALEEKIAPFAGGVYGIFVAGASSVCGGMAGGHPGMLGGLTGGLAVDGVYGGEAGAGTMVDVSGPASGVAPELPSSGASGS